MRIRQNGFHLFLKRKITKQSHYTRNIFCFQQLLYVLYLSGTGKKYQHITTLFKQCFANNTRYILGKP